MGKRHHYIPQFLLKNFSSKTDQDNKKNWLFQISSKGTCIESTTKNVALEKYFYGKEEVVETLLSAIEGDAATVLNKIISGENPNSHSSFLSNFLWMQSLRTRAAKSALIEAFSTTISHFFSSANESNLNERLVERLTNDFDDILAKELPLQLPSDRIVFEEMMKTPGFSSLAKDYLVAKMTNENVVKLVVNMFTTIGYSGIIEETLRAGYMKSVEKVVSNPRAPSTFNFEHWGIQKFEERALILGDICTFAVFEDGSIGSFFKFEEQDLKIKYVILPISSDTLLVGSNDAVEIQFNHDEVNFASAALSWDYIYSHSDASKYINYASKIASVEPIIEEMKIRKLVEKAWLER